VSYDDNGGSGPFIVTVQLNNGLPLPAGDYTFIINGSTSIVNQLRIRLAGNGSSSGTDFIRNFRVGSSLPDTGFAPNNKTQIPHQPREKKYTDLGQLWLEIPGLGLQMPIMGVPNLHGTWDVTWLGRMAGYLEGTAFPTLPGNTVLTAHVWDAWNRPGPFTGLKTLTYGSTFAIHIDGMVYTYQVRENRRVLPNDHSPLQHAEEDVVTLLTCEGFNNINGGYRFRRMVKGVLVAVAAE
jgi:LPXTG-site transpeptidase (sortase) family protein